MQLIINSDLRCIIQYSHGHNLMINIEKTQPIIIGSHQYVNQIALLGVKEININDVLVGFCETVKNLGVFFDNTLSWDYHTRMVIRRVFQTIAQVRRHFDVLPRETRKLIIQSLIMPNFDYSSVLFSNLTVSSSIKLKRAQNACLRFITGGRKYDHVTPLYNDLKMLKLNERRIVAQAILMWKIVKFKIPMNLYSAYVQTDVHSRENRHTSKTMPRHRTETFAKSFLVSSVKIWNVYELAQFQNYSNCNKMKIHIYNLLKYV